jgi:thiol:disulfide interchange protein DsbD
MAMYRHSLLLAAAFASIYTGCSTPDPGPLIPWAASLPLALESGAASGKPVLVYFKASWCSVCKSMERDLFRDSEVVEALQAFVPVTVDVDADPHLAKKYFVAAIPSLMILEKDGTVHTRIDGAPLKSGLLSVLRDSLSESPAAGEGPEQP